MKPESQRQIMIGGDEHTLSESTKSGLRAEGYQVTFSGDLMDLKNKASEACNVCAVIIDGDWKVFHFNNMVEEICEKLNTKPLFIFTAHYSITAFVHALKGGFDEFLAKPLGMEELITLINKKVTE